MEVSSWAGLRWWAGRRWAGDRGHLHLPRACPQSSAGQTECWPLGTPVTGFPAHSCDCHPLVLAFLCLLDGGCSDSSGLPEGCSLSRPRCLRCGGACGARPRAVSTWLCSGAFPWARCVFFVADCPGMVGNVKSVCARGSGCRGPRSSGDLREPRGLFSAAARRAARPACPVNAVPSASRSRCRAPELPRTRTPPSARSVATVTGRTACSSATAVMPGKREVLPAPPG